MAKGSTNNNKYEEARKQRLEENKKRFQDLGISKISKNLTEIASSAKKSPQRRPKLISKTNDVVEPRRSSRPRNSVPSYHEDVSIDLPPLRRRSRSTSASWGSYIARPLDEIKEATQKERSRALDAAEELKSNLQSNSPSFIKSMLRSHVYSCFWLGLPSKFCEDYLPKIVCNMILEDEDGSETEVVYKGDRSGLSGGWRKFALDHKLDDGDALVFQLVEADRFKVYIVRAFPDSITDGNKTSEEEGTVTATKTPKAGGNNRESESNKNKKRKQATVHEIDEPISSKDNLSEGNIDNNVKPHEISATKKTRFSKKKPQKKSKSPVPNESKEEAIVETVKPKAAAVKCKSKAKKAKKSEDIVHEIGEQLLSENNHVKSGGASPGKKNEFSQKKPLKKSKSPAPNESKKEALVGTVKPEAAATKNKSKANKAKKSEGFGHETGDSGGASHGKKNELDLQAGGEMKKGKAVEEASNCASQKPRKKPAPKLFRKRA